MARRIAVIGSRSLCNEDYTYPCSDWMFYHLDQTIGFGFDSGALDTFNVAILSGGAVGVDRCAQQYAEQEGIPFFLYKPYHLIDTKVRTEVLLHPEQANR